MMRHAESRPRRLLAVGVLASLAIAGAVVLAGCSSTGAKSTTTPFAALATATPTMTSTTAGNAAQQPTDPGSSTQPGAPMTPITSEKATSTPTGVTSLEPSDPTGQSEPSATATASTSYAYQPNQPANDLPAPTEGDWIDVNVTNDTVQLMDGSSVVQSIGPVAVGEQVNTGAYDSTRTGLFRVYSMTEGRTWDAPYQTYISDWVGFDPQLANGLHSFLEDANGNVVNASTGNVSNGCIRTPDPQAVYDFAKIGMPVYVHQ